MWNFSGIHRFYKHKCENFPKKKISGKFWLLSWGSTICYFIYSSVFWNVAQKDFAKNKFGWVWRKKDKNWIEDLKPKSYSVKIEVSTLSYFQVVWGTHAKGTLLREAYVPALEYPVLYMLDHCRDKVKWDKSSLTQYISSS